MVSLVFNEEELGGLAERTAEAVVRRIDSGRPRDKDAVGRILLTKREAAAALGISPATIDRLRRAGLPAVKLEGKVLFRPESLQKWAAENETSNGNGG